MTSHGSGKQAGRQPRAFSGVPARVCFRSRTVGVSTEASGPRAPCRIEERAAGTWNAHGSGTMSRSRSASVIVPAAGTALFLIDVINDLDFKGSSALVAQAEPMGVRLAALKRRAAAAGVTLPLCQRQLRSVAVRLPTHGSALHIALVARTARFTPSPPNGPRLFRPEAEAFGVLRHDARYASRDASHPPGDIDRDRRQHLRPLHGQ